MATTFWNPTPIHMLIHSWSTRVPTNHLGYLTNTLGALPLDWIKINVDRVLQTQGAGLGASIRNDR